MFLADAGWAKEMNLDVQVNCKYIFSHSNIRNENIPNFRKESSGFIINDLFVNRR